MYGIDDEFDPEYGYDRGSEEDFQEGSIYKDAYYEDMYEVGEEYAPTGNLDDADAWLLANSPVDPNDDVKQTGAESLFPTRDEEIGFGMESDYARQLKRFSHMPTGVIRRTIAMFEDPLSQASIYGSKESMSAQAMTEGIKSFESIIGASVSDFARDLKRQIPYGDITKASTAPQDVRTAFSMFATTGSIYAEKGSPMFGEEYTPEAQERKEIEMERASSFAYDLAHKSVTGNMGGARRETEVEKNYQFIMNQLLTRDTTSKQLVDWKTGQPKMQEVEVPVTDERGNLILTDGQPSYTTVKQPVLQSMKIPMPSEMPGIGTIPDDINQRFTYFNPKIYGDDEYSKELYGQAKDNWTRFSNALRRVALTSSDENRGNYLRAKNQLGLSDEHLQMQELRNEAMLLDLSRHKVHGAALSMEGYKQAERFLSIAGYNEGIYVSGGRLTGSDRGGMYNNEGLSEVDIFVEKGMEEAERTLSDEEVLERLEELRAKGASDRELYLARMRLSPQPKQGTGSWKEQRKGYLTGSHEYGNIRGEHKPETIERFAKELINPKGDSRFQSDEMKEGSAMEAVVRENLGRFLTGKLNGEMLVGDKYATGSFDTSGRKIRTSEVVSIEEAFFEKNPNLPGFSVSPDGFVFDKDGKSMGLAEFKYHTKEDKIKSSLDDYMHQLQKQMMVTGEEQVHFFRQTKSGKFAYDLVKADEGYQRKLKRIGKQILSKADELRGKKMPTYHAQVKGAGDSDAEIFYESDRTVEEASVFDPIKASGTSTRGKQATHMASSTMADYEAMFDALEAADLEAANEEAAQAAQAKANADKEAAAASRKLKSDFSSLGNKVVDTIGILAGLGREGLESGMGDIQKAAMAGMDEDQYRSAKMRFVREGGMTERQAEQTLATAGEQSARMANAFTAKEEYLAQTKALKTGGMDMWASFEEFRSLSPEQRAAKQQDFINSQPNAMMAARAASMIGQSAMAISYGRVTGEGVTTIDKQLDEEGMRAAWTGANIVGQAIQEGKEAPIAAGGEIAGKAIRLGEAASTAVALGKNTIAIGALTAAVIANTAAQGGSGLLGKTSKLTKLALGGASIGAALLTHSDDLGGGIDTLEGTENDPVTKELLSENIRRNKLKDMGRLSASGEEYSKDDAYKANMAAAHKLLKQAGADSSHPDMPTASIGSIPSATMDITNGETKLSVEVNNIINKDEIDTEIKCSGNAERHVQQITQ